MGTRPSLDDPLGRGASAVHVYPYVPGSGAVDPIPRLPRSQQQQQLVGIGGGIFRFRPFGVPSAPHRSGHEDGGGKEGDGDGDAGGDGDGRRRRRH